MTIHPFFLGVLAGAIVWLVHEVFRLRELLNGYMDEHKRIIDLLLNVLGFQAEEEKAHD